MNAELLKATVKMVRDLADAYGYAAADIYLDVLAEVWGEEVVLEVARGVWG